MRKRIKYIAAYDIEENKGENRVNVLSSTNKINYIISVLNDIGYDVDVISTSHTLNKKFYSGKLLKWKNNTLRLFPTSWRGGAMLKILNLFIINICLFFHLLINIQKKDTVIIYHSYGNLWMNILLKLKGVKVIVECEEIYGDIFNKKWMSALERNFLKKANVYIYPTKLLNKIVNKEGKPYLIIHGSYLDKGAEYFSDCKEESVEFDPSLYHIAYTGILDPKKGCLDVIRSGSFLDEEYHIHILGFGSQEEVDRVNQEIEQIKKETKCKISFDGTRKGQEYTNYLSHLDLGVCTLDPNQQFTMTQFPSKIISYMSAGIPVLCSEAKAILECDVAEAITFYKGNSPEDIAKGIIRAKHKNKIDTKLLLESCHQKFEVELKELLNA